MHARRVFVGSLSSIVWPAVVLLIPAGITFAAARVYAESSGYPTCGEQILTLCAAATADGEPCGPCASAACACFPAVCAPDASDPTTGRAARLCQRVLTCDAPRFSSCEGKTAGQACASPVAPDLLRDESYAAEGDGTKGSGVCVAKASACFRESAGVFGAVDHLDCELGVTTADAGATPPPRDDAGAGAIPTVAEKDDSGCATTPGMATVPLLGGPLAIGLLLALRRRRRRG